MVRVQAGKKENPTVAIADSQSGKHTGEIGQHLQVLYVGQGYTGERFAKAVSQLAGAKVELSRRKILGLRCYQKDGLWSGLSGGWGRIVV